MTRTDAAYGVVAALAVFLIALVFDLGGSLVSTAVISVVMGAVCAFVHAVVHGRKDDTE